MKCTNCGAPIEEGASVCPACGEPVSSDVPVSASVATVGSSKRPSWLIPVVAVIAVIVIGIGGYLLWSSNTASANTPEAAALRMMNAFATYDGQGVLDNATHASLTATDQVAFKKQAVDAKTKAKNLPAVKNIKVTKVTQDATDTLAATVELSAQWLTDQAKGTYTTRTETLSMVKQSGKWMVRLFK